jgi:hypothetical protein
MSPCKYKTRFLFIHQDMDFTETSKKLSVIPGINLASVSTKGDNRTKINGEPIDVKYHDSRLGFDFEPS